MNLQDADDRSVACAEFVLGTLTGEDLDGFMAALARDPALQAEVGLWQDRLLPLVSRAGSAEPGQALWTRIESALAPAAPAAATAASAAPGIAAGDPSPRPATTRRAATTPTLPWWQRLGFWRWTSGLAMAAAIALALLPLLRAPVEVQYVAVLQTQDGRDAGWVVQASDRGPVRLTPLRPPGSIPDGRAWQFWTKGTNAAGPTSLGLVPADGRLEVPRSRLPDLGDQQLFEITLEPETGSPIGRPTGPILYVGKASRI